MTRAAHSTELLFEPLLTPKEAAAAIGVCEDTLRSLVRSGELRFINVGTGKRRIRRMFDRADLAQFRDRRREVEACPSIGPKTRRYTSTTSGGEGVGFLARLQELRKEKRKK